MHYKCTKCPYKGRNVVALIVTMIIFVGTVMVLVGFSIANIDRNKPLTIVYFKILINHLQMLAAISLIDYKWP